MRPGLQPWRGGGDLNGDMPPRQGLFDRKTMIELIGLLTFIVVCLLNVAGLFLDLVLATHGWGTITHRVWAQPLLGLPILFVQGLGVGGLWLHFYWR